jgi:hypothetical protein
MAKLDAIEAGDTAEFAGSASLTDAAWAEICAAAKHAPDAEARAFLSAVLFEEYPAFARMNDRARVAKALRRAERMLKHLDAFAELYWQARLSRLPRDQFQVMVTGRADAFTMEQIAKQQGIKLVHVPYKGLFELHRIPPDCQNRLLPPIVGLSSSLEVHQPPRACG